MASFFVKLKLLIQIIVEIQKYYSTFRHDCTPVISYEVFGDSTNNM